jgi:hypothetical protein
MAVEGGTRPRRGRAEDAGAEPAGQPVAEHVAQPFGEPAGEPGHAPGADAESERVYIQTPEGKNIVPAARPARLTGGTPLLLLSDGRAVLSEARLGRGKVFVFSDFYTFTTEVMGHTGITPNARQRAISELEYWMLRELLGLPQPQVYWE